MLILGGATGSAKNCDPLVAILLTRDEFQDRDVVTFPTRTVEMVLMSILLG